MVKLQKNADVINQFYEGALRFEGGRCFEEKALS